MPRWRMQGALACCGALGLACSAWVSALQVEVQDAQGKPLADAVVFLESAEASAVVRPLPGLEMAQDKRQFLPTILVVPRGTAVQFPNRDTVRHHVYSFSPVKKFELKLYIGTPASPVVFDQAGVVVLGCNIHDQMVGWILVVDTPYYGMTTPAGQVRLDGLPAGNYRLRAWHSRLPVGAPAHDAAVQVPGAGAARAVVRMVGLQP